MKTNDTTVRKIGDYTGFTEKVIQKFNDLKNGNYYLKNDLDFINSFLSANEADELLNEIDNYVESIKMCAYLEREHEYIDFSSFDFYNKDNLPEIEFKRQSAIRNEWKEKEKTQRLHLFDISNIFLDYIKSYGNSIKDNFDLNEYLKEIEKMTE